MQNVKVTAGNCKIQGLQPNVIILSNKMMNQILPNLNTDLPSFVPIRKNPRYLGQKIKLI